jgi:hypothetical protein
MANVTSLLDILEPLASVAPSVMLYIGGINRDCRAAAKEFWHFRHKARCRGDFVRGKAVTRVLAAKMAGTKRKSCHSCLQKLALPWPFNPRISICNQCTKRKSLFSEYRLLSATDVSYEFGLKSSELWSINQFHTSTAKQVDGVPYLAGRTKFRREDVLILALEKYG